MCLNCQFERDRRLSAEEERDKAWRAYTNVSAERDALKVKVDGLGLKVVILSAESDRKTRVIDDLWRVSR